jgi:hypothetical protein
VLWLAGLGEGLGDRDRANFGHTASAIEGGFNLGTGHVTWQVHDVRIGHGLEHGAARERGKSMTSGVRGVAAAIVAGVDDGGGERVCEARHIRGGDGSTGHAGVVVAFEAHLVWDTVALRMIEEAGEGWLARVIYEDAGVFLPGSAERTLGEAFVVDGSEGSNLREIPDETMVSKARPRTLAGAVTARGRALNGETYVVVDAHRRNCGAELVQGIGGIDTELGLSAEAVDPAWVAHSAHGGIISDASSKAGRAHEDEVSASSESEYTALRIRLREILGGADSSIEARDGVPALAQYGGKVVCGRWAGAQHEDVEDALERSKYTWYVHAWEHGGSDRGDGKVGQLRIVDRCVGSDRLAQLKRILTPLWDSERGDARKRRDVHKVGTATSIIAKVHAISAAVAKLAVTVTCGNGDSDIAEHRVRPADIDRGGVAGGEGVGGGGGLEGGSREVVEEKIGLVGGPWPQASWGIRVGKGAAHDSLQHTPMTLGDG